MSKSPSSISGVSEFRSKCETSSLFIINDLTSDLKALIRKNLTQICYGADSAINRKSVYSLEKTLQEFLLRYKTKSQNIKMGMIGELLAHILILELRPNFLCASPFFNLEERSMKKGFDIVLFRERDRALWIAEVKSGEGGSKSASEGNRALLGLARRDLIARLKVKKSHVWLNAVNSARIAVSRRKQSKDLIVKILEEAFDESTRGTVNKTEVSAFFVSVLYKDLSDKVRIEEVLAFQQFCEGRKEFQSVAAITLQKKTFSKIEKFLKEEFSSK